MTDIPDEAKTKMAAKAERNADAAAAWNEYQDERATLAKRTAALRELRLAAEAEAAKKAPRKKRS